ncbi:MAG: pyridoxamine 5'-phosphate oxidase family protein [Actinomycetes bacterium]
MDSQPLLGPDPDAFLRSTTRTVLLGTRADGSPTGWPMTGLYPGGLLEFSTYAKSQKVRDFQRHDAAAVVVVPEDDRALTLRGAVEVRADQHEPSPTAGHTGHPETVASGVATGARARMLAGKRIILAFTPTAARFVRGLGRPADGGRA